MAFSLNENEVLHLLINEGYARWAFLFRLNRLPFGDLGLMMAP